MNRPNRNITLVLCFSLLLHFTPESVNGQWKWSFEKCIDREVKESKTGTPLRCMDTVFHPELVAGVDGKGLRTNGYSSWVEGKLPSSIRGSLSVSGWFALETFPTDTAGFFSLSNTQTGRWISACVNRFGELLIGSGQGGALRYTVAKGQLKKFAWNYVTLSLDNGVATMYINGKRQLSTSFAGSFASSEWNYLRVGRDEPARRISEFPLNVLNGIIDEVSIETPANTEALFAKAALQKGLRKRPDLSVPSTRFANDFNRPQYHLLPAANWTNETHGLLYYKGRYHIFNQKDGNNILLRQINWGHFSSPDLVHWTEHSPALTPEPGYDNLGIWSGHAVVGDNGKPVIVYTGGNEVKNGICLAFPKDSSLLEWEKYSGNPVINGQPKEFKRTDMRDPFLFQEGKDWYLIIGYGLVDNGVEKGTVLLYKSRDLKNWTFLHPLFIGDPLNDDSGVFWEMPVFWKLNGKYILQVNKVPYKGRPAVSLYWTGKFENERFVPDQKLPKRLEVVNRLLSPSVAFDAEGRTTAIAIIPDEISAEATYRQGWAHAFSVPRVWTLENDSIHQQPHPVLKSLRVDSVHIPGKTITGGDAFLVSKGKHQLEIKTQLLTNGCKRFGFVVGKNPNGSEATKIYLDIKEGKMVVDQTKSSKRQFIPLTTRTGTYVIDPNKVIDLHLFLDGSVVEVFINNKDAFTTRFFPLFGDSNEVEIFSEGGELQVLSVDVWRLKKGVVQTKF